MNRQLDPHYYKAYGVCLDCARKMETKHKTEGTWKEHTKDVRNQEIDHTIEEFKTFMEMKMNETNDGFVTESGEVEKWVGGINKERAEKALQEGIEYLKNLKK